MKFIKKNAEFIGHIYFQEEVFDEWRCPNKNCGFSVSEDYICCPYCGQRLKFNKLQKKGEITMPYMPTDRPYEIYTEDFLVDPKNGEGDNFEEKVNKK